MGEVNSREQLKAGVWDSDLNAHPGLGNGKQDEFEACGYKCFIGRNNFMTYVGYVQLPRDHPDYKQSQLNLDDIKVHGGITYSRDGRFGFDYSHAGDISPFHETMAEKHPELSSMKLKLSGKNESHYWTYEEAKEEIY